jgi:hypothetical protein
MTLDSYLTVIHFLGGNLALYERTHSGGGPAWVARSSTDNHFLFGEAETWAAACDALIARLLEPDTQVHPAPLLAPHTPSTSAYASLSLNDLQL